MRNRHTGGWILAGMLLMTFVPIGYYVYALCKSAIVVRTPEVVLELGDPVVLNPERYLSIATEDMGNVIIESDLNEDKTKYEYDDKTKEVKTKGLDYLDAGVYDITFTRENSNTVIPQNMRILVKDTVAPTFTNYPANGIVLEQYAVTDFKKYFQISDIDKDSEIVINTDQVNTLEQGIYTMKVITQDSIGNQNSKMITVTVVSEAEAEANPRALTRTIDGEVPISRATKARLARKELNKKDFEKQVVQ